MKKTVNTFVFITLALSLMLFLTSCNWRNVHKKNAKENNGGATVESDKISKEQSKNQEKNQESKGSPVPEAEQSEQLRKLRTCFDSFDEEGIKSLVAEDVNIEMQTKEECTKELLKGVKDNTTKRIFMTILLEDGFEMRKSYICKVEGSFDKGDAEEKYELVTEVPAVTTAEKLFAEEILKIDIDKTVTDIADKLIEEGKITAKTTDEEKQQLLKEALDGIFKEKAKAVFEKAGSVNEIRPFALKRDGEDIKINSFGKVIGLQNVKDVPLSK